MKKLLTLLFMFAVAFSLVMPVFAQEATGAQETTTTSTKTKKSKSTKSAKPKKPKTKTSTTATTTAPPAQ